MCGVKCQDVNDESDSWILIDWWDYQDTVVSVPGIFFLIVK